MSMRIEHDGLGELELPENAYYGIVSERNRRAFDVGPLTLDNYPSYIRAVALCKIACARANVEIGALDSEKAKYIEMAAREVADGKFKGEFVVNIYRGSGTPTNMIVNEVVAHRANELMVGSKTGPIHPNTHVNMCQSTNDLIPTAKEMVVYDELGKVIEAAGYFAEAFEKKAEEFADVIKMGRTCLQDAVPLTLGQEFGAYGHAARRLEKRLKIEREHWNKSCLGGTGCWHRDELSAGVPCGDCREADGSLRTSHRNGRGLVRWHDGDRRPCDCACTCSGSGYSCLEGG